MITTPLILLIVNTSLMKNMHNYRAGEEEKQQLTDTNYVFKLAFRYLNRGMHGIDWWNNPTSTSMALGCKICSYPGVSRIDVE